MQKDRPPPASGEDDVLDFKSPTVEGEKTRDGLEKDALFVHEEEVNTNFSEDELANPKDLTKKTRRNFERHELALLERTYRSNPCPSRMTRNQLACQMSTSPRVIQVWFQNRRTKDKRSFYSSDLDWYKSPLYRISPFDRVPNLDYMHANALKSSSTPDNTRPPFPLPSEDQRSASTPLPMGPHESYFVDRANVSVRSVSSDRSCTALPQNRSSSSSEKEISASSRSFSFFGPYVDGQDMSMPSTSPTGFENSRSGNSSSHFPILSTSTITFSDDLRRLPPLSMSSHPQSSMTSFSYLSSSSAPSSAFSLSSSFGNEASQSTSKGGNERL